MLNNMVKVLKFGLMDLSMKELMQMGKKMDMESYILLMDQNMKAILWIMKLMDMELMNGQIIEYILENGKTIK